jgi:hypothetical protein
MSALPQRVPPGDVISMAAQKAWQENRPAWTRADTQRWLDEQSANVLAWLRRREPDGAPAHSNKMGQWLQRHRTEYFARVHKRLLAPGADEAARQKITVWRAFE